MLRSVKTKPVKSTGEYPLVIPIFKGTRKLPAGTSSLDRATRSALTNALEKPSTREGML